MNQMVFVRKPDQCPREFSHVDTHGMNMHSTSCELVESRPGTHEIDGQAVSGEFRIYRQRESYDWVASPGGESESKNTYFFPSWTDAEWQTYEARQTQLLLEKAARREALLAAQAAEDEKDSMFQHFYAGYKAEGGTLSFAEWWKIAWSGFDLNDED